MPNNLLHEPWSEGEEAFVRTAGLPDLQMAHALNARFHGGQMVRTYAATQLKRRSLGVKAVLASKPKAPPRQQYAKGKSEQKVERVETEQGISLKALGSKLRTVEDVLAHAEIDLTKYEIVSSTAKKWDVTIAGPDGAEQVENFAIAVDVKPRVGKASVLDAVEAMITASLGSRKPVKARTMPTKGLMQAIVVADPHIGKLAWNRETRHGDYDLNIACHVLRDGMAHLMTMGAQVRHFWLLGDVFHYDTPNGTTTKGTPLDRDGRVQKMLEEGTGVIIDALTESAKQVPTVVTLIPGNHDTIMTFALQRILQAHFRATKDIRIDGGYEVRKYHQWGQCLFGLTHGDKAFKILPGLMAREAAHEWGQTTYRVIHKGHLHHRKSVETVDGVTVYQHPALCPPDGWHAGEGFVSDRGMESWTYHHEGGVESMRAYSPDLGKPVSRGTR